MRLAAAPGHAWGPSVSKELVGLADKIEHNGQTPEHLATLRALAILAVEHDSGEPVAKLLSAAIRVYTKPYVSPQQIHTRDAVLASASLDAARDRECIATASGAARHLTSGGHSHQAQKLAAWKVHHVA